MCPLTVLYNKMLLQYPLMRVRKTVLKDIIKADTQTIIEDVVCKSNIILKHTTLFLKLYLLYVFEKKEPFLISF